MFKLIMYAFNMRRLDKTLRKKFPKEMADQDAASLVKCWLTNNAGINICGGPRTYYVVADEGIRYLIKHPELLIKELSNQSQPVQDYE